MKALAVSLSREGRSERVGLLERFEDEEYRFSFDESWLSNPQRSVLGQLFEDRRPNEIATSGLPCWFAHLLPQGPLRRALAKHLAIDEVDGFDFLQATGADMPGAVSFEPAEPRIRGSSNFREIALPSSAANSGLRFSLAGAQWKLSVRQGERGLSLPVDGGSGAWIAKFHDPSFPELPRVEFATMTWATLCGIETPEFRLGRVEEIAHLPEGIPIGDGSLFLIKRFDRGEGLRVHMEDFGQILDRPPGPAQFSGSYEQIAAVLHRLDPDSVDRYFRQLIFCILCGNTDAHLKNWSVIYPDGRTPRLSLAYDVISTVVYCPSIEESLALTLGGTSRFDAMGHHSFERLARLTDRSFGDLQTLIKATADRIRSVWDEEEQHLDFSQRERAVLTSHLRRVGF